MAEISGFTDHEKMYFKLGEDGELYLVEPDPMGLDRGVLGSSVIDHIDRKTNTIWFSSPIPKAAMRVWKRRKRG